MSLTLFASNAPASLYLQGVVEPLHILAVEQSAGFSPQIGEALILDSGPILPSVPGLGVEVGNWSVRSNSSAALYLEVDYSPFQTTIEGTVYQIFYQVHNGESWVLPGSRFRNLIKEGGRYPEDLNNGPIFIKRTDGEKFPPSMNYVTSITFTLMTE